MAEPGSIKLYFDYKSPYAFLAMQPAFDLPERFAVEIRWIPYLLRIKGTGERSLYSEWKARYSYMDARRWANRRGGFPIKGPLKVYDSSASLIGGLYAQQHGFFRPYTEAVYARFFERQLEIDLPDPIAGLIQVGFGGLFELSHFMAWNRGYLIMPYFNMMLIAPQHTKEDIDGWLEVWDDIVSFAMGA